MEGFTQQKRKKCTNKAMDAAINSGRNGKLSILCAATLHGVLKTTLHDHISSMILHVDKSGPKQYFSAIDEKEITN